MRKFASVTIALIVAAGVMVATPANAAVKVSNGVACTKLNATTTVSGSKYKCAKNPLTTSTKLTWLSIDCLNVANGYIKTRNDSTQVLANLTAQIPILNAGITEQLAKIDAANLKKAEYEKSLAEAQANLVATEAKLASATDEAAKKTLAGAVKLRKDAVTSWTKAIKQSGQSILTANSQIARLKKSLTVASTTPDLLNSDLASTKQNAQLICTKGF